MQVLATILTATTILAHAVFGCCRHQESANAAATGDAVGPSHTCRCHHAPVLTLDGAPIETPNHDHADCCRHSCRAIPKPESDPLPSATTLRVSVIGALPGEAVVAKASTTVAGFPIGDSSRLALSVRADISVWLL